MQNENCDHIRKKSLGITSEIAYQKFLKPLLRPPTAQKSLEQAYNLNNVNWGKIYLLPRVITIDSSLKSFQYKILNNTLHLNECLFKFNIVDSSLCSICKQENESVIHLFAICSEARSLCDQLRTYTSSKNIILPSNLVPQVVILGVWDEKMQNLTLVIHLILIFKCYIYLKREDGLNFYGLKAYIKSIENIERHIASQRQKLDYHHKKMEQVNYCVIKYTRVLNMLGNCFPDLGWWEGFFWGAGGTGSEFLYMALCVKSKI